MYISLFLYIKREEYTYIYISLLIYKGKKYIYIYVYSICVKIRIRRVAAMPLNSAYYSTLHIFLECITFILLICIFFCTFLNFFVKKYNLCIPPLF